HRISIGINPERPAAEGGLGGEIMRLAALRIRSALRPLDPTRTLLIDAEGISIANALDVYLRLDLGGIAILGGQVGLALTLELLRPMLAEVAGGNGISFGIGCIGLDAQDGSAQVGRI